MQAEEAACGKYTWRTLTVPLRPFGTAAVGEPLTMLRWVAAAIAAVGAVCGITFAVLGKDALAVVSLGLVIFGLVLFFVGLGRNQT